MDSSHSVNLYRPLCSHRMFIFVLYILYIHVRVCGYNRLSTLDVATDSKVATGLKVLTPHSL